MPEYNNEGRVTVWKEKTGNYGTYVRVTFQLNGVEYIAFAEKVNSTHPKAPAYAGKLKIGTGNGKPQVITPVPATDGAGTDLPF